MPTVFSKIIAREVPAHIVYEDDDIIAFLDIIQATKGHTLVCLKEPFVDMMATPDDKAALLFGVVNRLTKAIDQAFEPEGITVISNNRAGAGQTVFHVHVHIIPRYQEDGVTIAVKNHVHETESEAYHRRAEAIRKAL
ncbi:MAG: HIT family protein [Acholeplasmataceae bacterium]